MNNSKIASKTKIVISAVIELEENHPHQNLDRAARDGIARLPGGACRRMYLSRLGAIGRCILVAPRRGCLSWRNVQRRMR